MVWRPDGDCASTEQLNWLAVSSQVLLTISRRSIALTESGLLTRKFAGLRTPEVPFPFIVVYARAVLTQTI
jgi:hypothetical protein